VSALSVHLNRSKPREVEAPATFSASQPFDIALENHGDGCGVHVQLDEALSAVVGLTRRERMVGEGETEHIRVNVGVVEEPVTGELAISLGYGTSTARVTVTVEPPEPAEREITVDESLGTPKQPAASTRPDVRAVALVAFAGVALVAAVAVAVTVESPVVLAAAVLVAVVAVGDVLAALS
jgi:hypothetical protein